MGKVKRRLSGRENFVQGNSLSKLFEDEIINMVSIYVPDSCSFGSRSMEMSASEMSLGGKEWLGIDIDNSRTAYLSFLRSSLHRFCWSLTAAESKAVFYTMIRSCRRLSVVHEKCSITVSKIALASETVVESLWRRLVTLMRCKRSFKSLSINLTSREDGIMLLKTS